jgi:nitrite reductase (NADH) small subunit
VILVCSVDDIPVGEGRAATVGGRRIAVFRAPSGWFALDATCPHRGGPLEDGIVADRSVICPLHERRFDLATGASYDDACPGVRAYPVEVRGNAVLVSLAEPARSEEPAATV